MFYIPKDKYLESHVHTLERVHFGETQREKVRFFKILALKNESHRRPEMQGAAFIWLKKKMSRSEIQENWTPWLWFYDTNFAIRHITEQNSLT